MDDLASVIQGTNDSATGLDDICNVMVKHLIPEGLGTLPNLCKKACEPC